MEHDKKDRGIGSEWMSRASFATRSPTTLFIFNNSDFKRLERIPSANFLPLSCLHSRRDVLFRKRAIIIILSSMVTVITQSNSFW